MTETTAQAAGTNTQTISSSISIQPIAEFNPDTEIGASLATRWTTWLDDFEMFLLASGIQDTKRQRALLLYQAGSRVREIFRQLNDTGEDDDYERAGAERRLSFWGGARQHFADKRARLARG